MKDLIKEIRGGVYFVSPEETDIDYYNDLNRIEKESGIYVVSWKHLDTIAIKDDRCVGALYTGITGDTYSFDVIVDKSFRGIGIGTRLIDFGIGEYKEIKDTHKLELKVVNAHLIPHLEKRGMKVVKKEAGHIIMTF